MDEDEVGRSQSMILKIRQAMLEFALDAATIPALAGDWLHETADLQIQEHRVFKSQSFRVTERECRRR
ncbi:MAG: hypothetical protein WA446_03945 [Steroidobacteraceae bacterium]